MKRRPEERRRTAFGIPLAVLGDEDTAGKNGGGPPLRCREERRRTAFGLLGTYGG